MNDNVLYRDPQSDLVFERAETPPDDFLALLRSTHWGTDGLRYVMNDVAECCSRLPEAHYLTLRQAGRALGTILLIPRWLTVGGITFLAYCRALLAVEQAATGRGYGALIARLTRDHYLNDSAEPTLLYGIVENGNQRSMRVQHRMGYEPLLSFELTNFGHLRPRAIRGLSVLEPHEVDSMRSKLREFYADHVLCEFERSFIASEYWVLRDGNRIIAGVQVVPHEVTVTHLEGTSGKFFRAASAVLARFNPYFKLAERKYLWFGNLFTREGHVPDLFRLLEGVLAEFEMCAAALYSDRRSPICDELHQRGLGALHRISPPSRLTVFAGQHGLPEDVLTQLRSRPVAFSPLDCL